MFRRWFTPGLVLLTAAAVYALASRSAPAPADAAAAHPAPIASGVRVAVDPATGEIVARPTAADLVVAGPRDRVERRRADELERFDLPGGASGVVLDRWADHALRVERAGDGTLRLVCARRDRHGEVR